ncbi:MAG: hypothetical protein M0R06_02505 [Sphaerochaeta sp.]|jgi:hypothetical protein|nr:hypothetical protein [Sphaerochaeta sp.]
MNYQDAAVLAEYTGGEIEKQPESSFTPDQTSPEYSVSIDLPSGERLALGSGGWFIINGFGESVFTSDDIRA